MTTDPDSLLATEQYASISSHVPQPRPTSPKFSFLGRDLANPWEPGIEQLRIVVRLERLKAYASKISSASQCIELPVLSEDGKNVLHSDAMAPPILRLDIHNASKNHQSSSKPPATTPQSPQLHAVLPDKSNLFAADIALSTSLETTSVLPASFESLPLLADLPDSSETSDEPSADDCLALPINAYLRPFIASPRPTSEYIRVLDVESPNPWEEGCDSVLRDRRMGTLRRMLSDKYPEQFPKNKRGRPRKQPNVLPTTEKVTPPPKRPRGRPRKPPIIPTEKGSPPSKRPRGRPRLHPLPTKDRSLFSPSPPTESVSLVPRKRSASAESRHKSQPQRVKRNTTVEDEGGQDTGIFLTHSDLQIGEYLRDALPGSSYSTSPHLGPILPPSRLPGLAMEIKDFCCKYGLSKPLQTKLLRNGFFEVHSLTFASDFALEALGFEVEERAVLKDAIQVWSVLRDR